MKRTLAKSIGFFAVMSLLACQMAVAVPAGWGSAGAKVDPDPGVDAMLAYALQDEYTALAEYRAIMRKFGTMNPFANIARSEERHIDWLLEEYAVRGLAPPADDSAAHLVVPGTIKQALEIGVQAEIDNIAMYDRFLASPLLRDAANTSLKDLFTRLRDSSENHLAAFRNGLSRY